MFASLLSKIGRLAVWLLMALSPVLRALAVVKTLPRCAPIRACRTLLSNAVCRFRPRRARRFLPPIRAPGLVALLAVVAAFALPSQATSQVLKRDIPGLTTDLLNIQAMLYSSRGVPIATRNEAYPNGAFTTGGSSLQGEYRDGYYIACNCTGLRVCIGNWWTPTTNAGDTANSNAWTIDSVSIETVPLANPASGPVTVVPLFFGGQKSVTLQPGATVWSDAIWQPFTAGQLVAIRVHHTVASSGYFLPKGYAQSATTFNEGYIVGATTPDITGDYNTQGAAFSFGGQNANKVTIGLWGIPYDYTQTVIAAVGDSVMGGKNDTSTGAGWFARAMGSTNPYIRIAVSGETVQTFITATGAQFRLGLVNHVKVAVYNYGINDTFAGRTLAQLQADTRSAWQILRNRGVQRIWACTLTPRTTSGDGWTTLTQGAVTGESVRQAYNDWIRQNYKSEGLSGYFDMADVCESARNSGLWIPGATADGIHPTSTYYANMAAIVNPAVFQGSPSMLLSLIPVSLLWRRRLRSMKKQSLRELLEVK